MIGSTDVLPNYPGYALGGIITEGELLLPRYEKKCSDLQAMLEHAEATKTAEVNSPKYKTKDTEQKNLILMTHGKKILGLKKEIQDILVKIGKLYDVTVPFTIQETLPLDYKVELRNHNRAFSTERMNHLVFSNNEPNVQQSLENFVSSLFLQDTALSVLPGGTIEDMVKRIETMLKTVNVAVAVIGSFITLGRVKTLEPLILSPNTRLGENLENHPENYYVLSEAVLGGVFIGLGKSLSVVSSEETKDIEWAAKLSTISFVSQGAIPKFNCAFHKMTLWDAYLNWKEQLLTKEGGYPVGFKVRPLKSVLKESRSESSLDSSKDYEHQMLALALD